MGQRCKTLVAAFFAFLSLNLYVCHVRKGGRKFYIGCIATYILALMSKPTSTPLPVMMLLMDYWPLKRFNRQAVLEKIPFFVVGAISAVITYISQTRTATVGLPTEYGPERIPLSICYDIVFYPYKIFWPVRLSSYYPFPSPLSLTEPTVALGIIGTCTLIPLLIISLRRTRGALTGWLIFFIGLLPTTQIIGFSNYVASDKFAYIPSIGLLLALTALGSWCWKGSKAGEPKGIFSRLGALTIGPIIVAVTVLISAGAEAVATRQYLVHWRDTLSLSQYMLELTPDVPQVLNLRAYAFQKAGNLDEAVKQYLRTLEKMPNYVDARNNLAVTLKLQGKLNEAADHYRKALQVEPKNADIHYNLANTLQSLGNLDEAISQYYEVLKIKPNQVHAHLNLANALSEQGKFDEAISHYRQALKVKSLEAAAYNNIGTILQTQGKLDEAIDCYSRAIRSKPDFVEAYRNLASLLESQGYLEEAITCYSKVLQFNPDDFETHLKIGGLLASQNKFDEAISHFSQALRIEPNNADACFNMGVALAMTDKPREAIEYLRQAMQLKPSWSEPAIWLARIFATYPDPEVRDPNNAVIIATQAAELTKHQNPEVLETLAASYAATGQLERALKTAQEALTLADAAQNNELVGRLRSKIEQYKQATTLNTKSAVSE